MTTKFKDVFGNVRINDTYIQKELNKIPMNYIGNKRKIIKWIYKSLYEENIKLENYNVFDALAGSGSFSVFCRKIGCKTVTITGGEPFLRKDIYEIINYCQEFDVEILTNSTLLDKEKIKEIGEKFPQLKRIKISIDGLGGHDINRWPSNYKKIIENFNYFKRYTKCVLIANTVITQYTIDELMDLYKILKKIPINIWRIDLPFFAGIDPLAP